jgi:hypothetical protein
MTEAGVYLSVVWIDIIVLVLDKLLPQYQRARHMFQKTSISLCRYCYKAGTWIHRSLLWVQRDSLHVPLRPGCGDILDRMSASLLEIR